MFPERLQAPDPLEIFRDGYELPNCWDWNSGPLQKQYTSSLLSHPSSPVSNFILCVHLEV